MINKNLIKEIILNKKIPIFNKNESCDSCKKIDINCKNFNEYNDYLNEDKFYFIKDSASHLVNYLTSDNWNEYYMHFHCPSCFNLYVFSIFSSYTENGPDTYDIDKATDVDESDYFFIQRAEFYKNFDINHFINETNDSIHVYQYIGENKMFMDEIFNSVLPEEAQNQLETHVNIEELYFSKSYYPKNTNECRILPARFTIKKENLQLVSNTPSSGLSGYLHNTCFEVKKEDILTIEVFDLEEKKWVTYDEKLFDKIPKKRTEYQDLIFSIFKTDEKYEDFFGFVENTIDKQVKEFLSKNK